MDISIMLRKGRLVLGLFSMFDPVHGQVLPSSPGTKIWGSAPQIQQVWDAGSLVEGAYLGDHVTIQDQGMGPVRIIKAPHGSSGLTIWGGNHTALLLSNEKILLYHRVLNQGGSLFDTSLNTEGEKRGLKGVPITLHEASKDGYFLGVNLVLGFREEKVASPFSWWCLSSQDVLIPVGILPLELDGPVFISTPENFRGPCMTLSQRNAGLVPFLEFPVRVPGAFVVASLGAGILWTVKDDTLKVHRVIKLLPKKADEWAAKADHARVIHAIQPTPDGRLLVALRSPEASVLKAEPGGKAAKVLEEVIWKEVDPLEGTVQDADDQILRAAPRTLVRGRNLTFRLDSQGRVVAGAKAGRE